MKICSKCKKEYPLEMFIKNKHCRNGRAGKCSNCQNEYIRNWKRRNRDRLAPIRRKQYAERYGAIIKERKRMRQMQYPLRVRCQLLRTGMKDRSRNREWKFDNDYFSVGYLMGRLSHNPNCECCNKPLDISFKSNRSFNENSPSMDRVDPKKGYIKGNVAILCWRCNKLKQDANSQELRMIANFMDVWDKWQRH